VIFGRVLHRLSVLRGQAKTGVAPRSAPPIVADTLAWRGRHRSAGRIARL